MTEKISLQVNGTVESVTLALKSLGIDYYFNEAQAGLPRSLEFEAISGGIIEVVLVDEDMPEMSSGPNRAWT